ncbi:MAG TPA: class I SAM-dependent rRNA methyltransferase [Polyangiales bacterium]|nr:class I SAM-dependent rRNA methyltransferase [Polyangiales bacterium]
MPRAVRLNRPLERAIMAGHPWIYRDALAPFSAPAGEVVDVFDKRGRLIAKGVADAGPIGVRVYTTQAKERVGPDLFRERIASAFALRARAVPAETDAYRLLHGEGDRLPGVVVDRYRDFAVLKLDGEGVLPFREQLAELLEGPLRELGVRGLLTRTSRKQGNEVEQLWGDAPEREVAVNERGMRLLANLWEGQKTGLFLDHRESRARVRSLARELSVLNLYGYTGGFSVAAGLGGASDVTTVDLAKPAIELAARTWEANALRQPHQALAEDVAEFLTRAHAEQRRYQLVVADPPNFAPAQAKLDVALESYATLHGSALGLIDAGGLYLAASCSSHVRSGDFLDTLREGARRARRVLTILEQTGAPFDHPRLLAFPEGDYLKVALCRVT